MSKETISLWATVAAPLWFVVFSAILRFWAFNRPLGFATAMGLSVLSIFLYQGVQAVAFQSAYISHGLLYVAGLWGGFFILRMDSGKVATNPNAESDKPPLVPPQEDEDTAPGVKKNKRSTGPEIVNEPWDPTKDAF
jgi:hypothetical protein